MSRNDELDSVLSSIKHEEDWEGFTEILKLDSLPSSPKDRRILLNREIRHSYGHTFPNMFRDEFEPDYIEILRETAKKMDIKVRDHHTVLDIENKILIEVIDRAKEQIIKEKGPQAWAQIEQEAAEEVRRAIEQGRIPKEAAEDLKGIGGGTLLAAIIGGRLAGFSLYIVANQIFFAMARTLGLRIGVAIAGPVIGRVLALFLGPLGWVLGGLWLLFDLGNTSWKKVIPAVILVAILRGKQEYPDFRVATVS